MLSIGVYNRPFMIGICQGQTELSSGSSRRRPCELDDSEQGAPFAPLSVAYMCSCSSFSASSFCIALGQRPSVTNHSFARIQPCEKAFTED